jgi:hypothetical protein
MAAGLYVGGESEEYASPGFVFVKPKKADDPEVDNLKRNFERKLILPRHKSIDEVIHGLEEHFSLRLVVDLRDLNKRVVPDPCLRPRPKQMASRIGMVGMEKKKFKTVLDLKYGFRSMGFYKNHSKFTIVITPFGVFIPTRLAFRGKNGPDKMQRIADH